MFCPNCGVKLSDQATTCPKCGHPIKKSNNKNVSMKSRLAAVLLAWFLGFMGAHRYYLGKIGSAIVMTILTLTLYGIIISGIWAFVDMIVILCGGMTDKDGKKVLLWIPQD